MPFYYGVLIPAEIVLGKLAESSKNNLNTVIEEKDKAKLNLALFISKLYHVPITPELEEAPINFWKNNCKSLVPYSDISLFPVQQGKYILCGKTVKFPENTISSAVGFLDTQAPKEVRSAIFNFLQQNNLRNYEPMMFITDGVLDLYDTQCS